MQIKESTVLNVNNLEVHLKDSGTTIIYDSFNIELNDFVLIKGKNGSGKTTLFKLFKPYDNEVKYITIINGSLNYKGNVKGNIFDLNSNDLSKLNREIVDITQVDSFITSDTPYTAMFEPAYNSLCYNMKIDKREAKNIIDNKIKQYYDEYLKKSFKCDWNTFKKKNVKKFSGGQQKIIHLFSGLIKAELADIKLILMDEPSNNLDAINKWIVSEIIKKIRAQKDIAIMLISHCLIFEGINKVIEIEKKDINKYIAKIRRVELQPHYDCLERCK